MKYNQECLVKSRTALRRRRLLIANSMVSYYSKKDLCNRATFYAFNYTDKTNQVVMVK